MWEERVSWTISWSGTTVWGNDYNDNKSFDNEQDAAEFCVELGLKNDVDYISLKKSIIWRKKRKA